jgi:tRNA nucleotidyltransferase (CCA-adding enzyme)
VAPAGAAPPSYRIITCSAREHEVTSCPVWNGLEEVHCMFSVKPPAAVVDIMTMLRRAGHTCYVAGGAVRDIVMGRTPADWDIACSATPEQIRALFARTIPTGVAHGTVTVLHRGASVEVTTYRHDGPYSDGRHPDYIQFVADVCQDLARRDFTMNAMAYDPIGGRLVDPFHGKEHIERRLIMCVGDPMVRFSEDKLRMVRAARFAAVLDFDIHDSIIAACTTLAAGVSQVSAERVIAELKRLLGGVAPSRGLRLLDDTGLMGYIFPELVTSVDAQRRSQLYSACDDLPMWAWERAAMVLSPLGPVAAEQSLMRLRSSRNQATTVAGIIRGAERLADICLPQGRMPDAAELRAIARATGPDSLLAAVRVHLATRQALAATPVGTAAASGGDMPAQAPEADLGGHPLVLLAASVLASNPPLRVGELAINGRDVIAVTGIERGPAVRTILERLLDEVIRDPSANTRDRLLELAERFARGGADTTG